MEITQILNETNQAMDKAISYIKEELNGIHTGRANTSLVEYVKVDYYGSPTDLRSLAMISVPEATQLLIKPFDASSTEQIAKAIENAGLGLNPQIDGKQIRINIPALSGERRKQMVSSVKQMGEKAKVSVRNARRDGNKHIDKLAKDKTNHISEDEADSAKDDVQKAVKKYEQQIDDLLKTKINEIEQI